MKKPLFDRTGVRYEVAVDIIGALNAHYSEQIANERSKEVPDETTIRQLDLAKSNLRALREGIDPEDDETIERVIGEYGPQARELYK